MLRPDGAIGIRVPLPLRLLDSDQDYRRHHQAENSAEEEDPVPAQQFLDAAADGEGQAVAEVDAPVVDADGSTTELLQLRKVINRAFTIMM